MTTYANEVPREALRDFLEQDELRHITPLKMLAMFGDVSRVFRISANDEHGYVLTMLRAASIQWDNEKYPDATHVVYVALRAHASDALIEATAQCILRETRGEPFVVKTIESRLIDALQASKDSRMPMIYRLSLSTFIPDESTAIANEAAHMQSATHNSCYAHVPTAAQELLATHNVYNERDLATMFADGSARCWLRFLNEEPVAVLLTFANTNSLHEIGSLHVHTSARRAGHARSLVRDAIDDLRNRGLSLRYVVDTTNKASIALAELCGLRLALRLEHWGSR
jgi:ribosomal protein S18 acetylase RimI-like enzyme